MLYLANSLSAEVTDEPEAMLPLALREAILLAKLQNFLFGGCSVSASAVDAVAVAVGSVGVGDSSWTHYSKQ